MTPVRDNANCVLSRDGFQPSRALAIEQGHPITSERGATAKRAHEEVRGWGQGPLKSLKRQSFDFLLIAGT